MSKLLGSLTQADVPTLSYRVTNGLNECLYLAANEPSLGLYRIQEHIQGEVPKVVESRQNLQQMCERVNGASYDVEYDTGVVREMGGVTHFSTVSAALDRAIYLKRELDTRRRTLPRTVDPSHTTPPSRTTRSTPPPPRNYGSITDSGETIQPKTFN